MNFLDIIVLIPAAWFAFQGLRKGLIAELCGLIALVLGIYISVNFSEYLGSLFEINGKYAEVISFIICFLAVIIVVFLLGKLIETMAKASSMGIFNHLLGLIFGLMKVVVIFGALFYFIHKNDTKNWILKENIKSESAFFYPLQKLADCAINNKNVIDEFKTLEKE